jgi:hypothetical protein
MRTMSSSLVCSGCMCFLALVSLPSCGSSTPTAPTVNLNGNYAGTASDSLFGSGTLQLTISQTGNNLSGTYSSNYPAAGASGGGAISGTVNNGQTVSATLQPSIPTACPYQLTGVIAGGGANVSGTYASFNCTVGVTGTFNVNRQ